MKKLMVVLAAVALAMGVNAASVDWNMTIAGKGKAYADAGAFAMAFNGSDFATVINLLTVTGGNSLATDLGKLALAKDGVTQFTFGNSRGSAKIATTSAQDPSGTEMFWVVFENGNMDANSSISWTDKTDVSASIYTPPATGTAFELSAANLANSGTIATAAVPEPTSGLLLLIGMAGMALRRRRA